MKSDPGYGPVTRALHWTVAVLMVALLVVPLAIMAFAAPLRVLLLAPLSFFPEQLGMFNEIHGFIYAPFIPLFGDLFPYWFEKHSVNFDADFDANNADNVEAFAYLAPGEYDLDVYVATKYRSGFYNQGSRGKSSTEIRLHE